MSRLVTHDLAVRATRDELAGQDFTSALRGYLLNDMAAGMKARFEGVIAPRLAVPPGDGRAVHAAMQPDTYFRFYSALRIGAQEMVWASVGDAVARDAPRLAERTRALSADRARAQGTLTLDPALPVPRNVTGVNVHHMPAAMPASITTATSRRARCTKTASGCSRSG